MPPQDSVDCLIVIDAQKWILDLCENQSVRSNLIRKIADTVDTARNHGTDVLWIQFRTMDDSDGGLLGKARLLSECGYRESDPIITKFGIDAFSDTSLDQELGARQTGRIALAGFSTAHAVLATASTAVRLGYEVIVYGSACSAPTKGEHEHALQQLSKIDSVTVL
ncbi:cysteine hydrolase [Corynebacterium genitalium ATCC 33030]|uniref:Isochorismatase family protein n=1 Tax=Corynebacterium genitalium ATCC 33030 TaxID=585529 RepID=D7WC61_9CORY|nr:cysteine hydrolase [Corynebacterium genitalium]EFK54690.1 isochorismatase family protein [Corynebacterium genitalium ATCC 33030]UUA88989.1 cysteine hydrolase [Corynebacterium genitalium ATCC 33030]